MDKSISGALTYKGGTMVTIDLEDNKEYGYTKKIAFVDSNNNKKLDTKDTRVESIDLCQKQSCPAGSAMTVAAEGIAFCVSTAGKDDVETYGAAVGDAFVEASLEREALIKELSNVVIDKDQCQSAYEEIENGYSSTLCYKEFEPKFTLATSMCDKSKAKYTQDDIEALRETGDDVTVDPFKCAEIMIYADNNGIKFTARLDGGGLGFFMMDEAAGVKNDECYFDVDNGSSGIEHVDLMK